VSTGEPFVIFWVADAERTPRVSYVRTKILRGPLRVTVLSHSLFLPLSWTKHTHTQGLNVFPMLLPDYTYVLEYFEFLLTGICNLWSVSCKEALDAIRRFVETLLSVVGIHNCRVSVFHLVVSLTTGPKPLPKRALHIVRSRASSFKWEYSLFSIRSSSSFLHLLPRLPATSIPPFISPSVTRCRRQLLRKMWPIQLAFRLVILCRIILCSLTLSNTRAIQ
jgi:hypothetical protein